MAKNYVELSGSGQAAASPMVIQKTTSNFSWLFAGLMCCNILMSGAVLGVGCASYVLFSWKFAMFQLLPQAAVFMKTNTDPVSWHTAARSTRDFLGIMAEADFTTPTYESETDYTEYCSSRYSENECRDPAFGQEKDGQFPCVWGEYDPPCQTNTLYPDYDGSSASALVTRKVTFGINADASNDIKEELKRLESALTKIVDHLPSPDDRKQVENESPPLHKKICSNNTKPMDVESSLINFPQAIDVTMKVAPCAITKIGDNAGLTAKEKTVDGFIEGYDEIFHVCDSQDTARCRKNMRERLLNQQKFVQTLFGKMSEQIVKSYT